MRRIHTYVFATFLLIAVYLTLFIVIEKDLLRFMIFTQKTPRPESRELDLVIGIPSIKRPRGAFYLGDCLRTLLENRSGYERMMIIVFLADEDLEWGSNTKTLLTETFAHEVENDLIRIIQPPPELYNTLETQMVPAFGDPPDHIRWRTKENLDMAYLMEFSYNLNAKYFLGFEDDVKTTTQNYAERIITHAKTYWRNDTIYAAYADYPSIGKLFKHDKLPLVWTYLKLFAGYKPIDWLYYDLARLVSCGYPLNDCNERTKKVVINYGQRLFTHIGNEPIADGR